MQVYLNCDNLNSSEGKIDMLRSLFGAVRVYYNTLVISLHIFWQNIYLHGAW